MSRGMPCGSKVLAGDHSGRGAADLGVRSCTVAQIGSENFNSMSSESDSESDESDSESLLNY